MMFTFDETFWSNAFFTLVNLLLLYVILKKILFKPVTKFMENRNKKIQDTLDATEATKADIEELKLQYQESIKQNETRSISLHILLTNFQQRL